MREDGLLTRLKRCFSHHQRVLEEDGGPFAIPELVDTDLHTLCTATSTMPVESPYPRIDVPNVGIWDHFFERKDRSFGEDKGWMNTPRVGQHNH